MHGCVVVCGAGQNGGDGFVIARHLANRGADVRIYLVAPRARVTGDARVFLEVAERLGLADRGSGRGRGRRRAGAAASQGAELIVDAIFGTGLRDEVRGAPAAAIAAMNGAAAFRVAVDIPSGLDADSGQVRGVAVKADLTATMGALKPGLVLDAEAPVGRLAVVDLGVSVEALADAARAVGPLCRYLEASRPSRRPVAPPRPRRGTRARAGTSCVVAGSARQDRRGPAVGAGRPAGGRGAGHHRLHPGGPAGARRQGAGGDDRLLHRRAPTPTSRASIRSCELGRRMQAVGPRPRDPDRGGNPGAGPPAGRRASPAAGHRRRRAQPSRRPRRRPGCRGPPAPRVLTPHPGEMARLLGVPTADRAGRSAGGLPAAGGSHRRGGGAQGARTVIAEPDGSAWLNPAADSVPGDGGQRRRPDRRDRRVCWPSGLPIGWTRPWLGVFAHGESAAEARRARGTRYLVAGRPARGGGARAGAPQPLIAERARGG